MVIKKLRYGRDKLIHIPDVIETIKLLEENIGGQLLDLDHGTLLGI